MYVCMYMCVFMYIRVYVCVCMYVCMYREQAEANALKRQSMRPDERISFYDRASLHLGRGIVCMYVSVYVCMCQ